VTESLVDFNRAGCALVEIVFLPDIRSANDAASVVSTLRDVMRYIGTCDGRMEEGSLRCDLNISIAPLESNDNDLVDDDNPFQNSLPPGTGHRVEVKNLNSMKQGMWSC
jgi:aspartyl-tRNA(Asn)/glutamyl-tRNA(Gln) amidotransferase subunit B